MTLVKRHADFDASTERWQFDMAQTSDRISGLASRYANIRGSDIADMDTLEKREELAGHVRAMAASLLRQDEFKGLRGLVRKVTGI